MELEAEVVCVGGADVRGIVVITSQCIFAG